MKLFKQTYQAHIFDGDIECRIMLEPIGHLSYTDIASLTNGTLPYSIRFLFKVNEKLVSFGYYQWNGVYTRMDSKWVSIPYGMDVNGIVTLSGNSQDCMDDFGIVNVGINAAPKKVVLYGVKSTWGTYSFESNKESAVSTHKITITPNGYEIVGLGKDRYCRVLDKSSKYYGQLFSEVEDKEYLMQYYWKYRKKRCINMDALASALGQNYMGGTSRYYHPIYVCED